MTINPARHQRMLAVDRVAYSAAVEGDKYIVIAAELGVSVKRVQQRINRYRERTGAPSVVEAREANGISGRAPHKTFRDWVSK